MNLLRIVFVACMLSLSFDVVYADDAVGDTLPVFEGEVELEANYGRNGFGEHRNIWDFPHITVSGDLRLGKGWAVSAELEYERFYEDGMWHSSFKDNFAANKLYVSKTLGRGFNIKGGIIDVPVGLANSGGPSLTIYDPESEECVLPISWHETGVALWWEHGSWRHELSAISCLDFPLNRSCALGMSFRTEFMGIAEGLRVGASGYWGKSSCGMVQRCRAGDFIGTDGVFFGCVDFDFQKNGWIVDGSAIYCTDNSVKSAGLEAGYDLAVAAGWSEYGVALVPFMRYDGVFSGVPMNKFTFGANVSPYCNFVLKVEYGHKHFGGLSSESSFDVGIGYSFEI